MDIVLRWLLVTYCNTNRSVHLLTLIREASSCNRKQFAWLINVQRYCGMLSAKWKTYITACLQDSRISQKRAWKDRKSQRRWMNTRKQCLPGNSIHIYDLTSCVSMHRTCSMSRQKAKEKWIPAWSGEMGEDVPRAEDPLVHGNFWVHFLSVYDSPVGRPSFTSKYSVCKLDSRGKKE